MNTCRCTRRARYNGTEICMLCGKKWEDGVLVAKWDTLTQTMEAVNG